MSIPQELESKDWDFRHHFMMSYLFSKYKTAMIPYHDVAHDYLNWKSKKTADARLKDGSVKDLNLDVICPGKSQSENENKSKNPPAFVEVTHLTDFLLAKRNVCIY